MAGTRSSARQSAQSNNSSSPQSAKASNGTKRKADDATTSPSANSKAKRGRPSKGQATLEETMPDADGDAAEGKQPMNEEKGGDLAPFERPEGCWGWFDDHAKVDLSKAKAEHEKHGGVTIEHGSSFKGKTEVGEDKSDPEKSLKDSRGLGGSNIHPEQDADGEAAKASPSW